jgi:alkylhydroperoxidase/carboxymuconolactone decarboxylase family protein YurZ
MTASTKEIAIAALSTMGNAGQQLRVHIPTDLHVGVQAVEFVETVMQMSATRASRLLKRLAAVREVFARRFDKIWVQRSQD